MPSLCSDVFFFQAEDGIRDATVTGVQTCALPILGRLLDAKAAQQYCAGEHAWVREGSEAVILTFLSEAEGDDWVEGDGHLSSLISVRSEERRVGKEWRGRWAGKQCKGKRMKASER